MRSSSIRSPQVSFDDIEQEPKQVTSMQNGISLHKTSFVVDQNKQYLGTYNSGMNKPQAMTPKQWQPFKLTKRVNKKKYNNQWNNQIDKFFKTLKQTRQTFPNQKTHLTESDVRNFILFHSTLKCSFSARICLTYFNIVREIGTFLDVLALNKLKQVINKFRSTFGIQENQFPFELYFQLYKKHILAYELYKSHKIQTMQPVNIDKVKYFSAKQVDDIIKNKREDVQFNRDILVMQGFAEYVGFDEKMLSAEYFKQNYGQQIFDTRIQRADAFGFDIYTSHMNNDQVEMKASQYIEYQQLQGTPQVKKLPIHKKLKKNEVCFAVNVELVGKQQIESEIHTKLQKVKYVQYLNELDALSYCQDILPGCNHPQLYFKVKGVWTGGHQQNVSMCSINVNLGPDDSEWFTLDIQHVPRLRKEIIEMFGIDIIQHEGLWFAPPDWMIANNYPIKKLIQKKGDLVYSGAGTLHWVRSLGKCLQVSWNIFPKTQKQWKESVARMNINEQIMYRQIFMPLKSIGLKILNHEYQKRTPFVEAIQQSIIQWQYQELQLVQQYQKQRKKLKNIKYVPLQDFQSLCEKCRSQFFRLYGQNSKKQILCFRCYTYQEDSHKNQLFFKHKPEDVEKLLVKIKNLRELKKPQTIQQTQVAELCCKQYCGQVDCAFQQKTDRVNDSIVEYQQINQPQLTQSIRKLSEKYLTKKNPALANTFNQIVNIQFFNFLSQNMPKRSWESTEQFLEFQNNVVKQRIQSLSFSLFPIENKIALNKEQEQNLFDF